MANVLVIGSGGREHALAWKLKKSPEVCMLYCSPGNAGIAQVARTIDLGTKDYGQIVDFCKERHIDLAVIGPEDYLCNGLVDKLEENGISAFGPTKSASFLEGSKSAAKKFMLENSIPTASYEAFTDPQKAIAYIQDFGSPLVIKADGLCAGKGVFVCESIDKAVEAVEKIMMKKDFGASGGKIVVEEFLEGEEASILALCDGETAVPLISAQDHKRVNDDDQGDNTGGMGAYAPAPVVTSKVMQKVMDNILMPTVKGMQEAGTPFKGCLYAGLMIKDEEPKVVEFNVRFGDPETQPVLMMLKSDLYGLMQACVEGNLDKYVSENPIYYHRGSACCVVVASGGYPGHYEKGIAISGLEKCRGSDYTVVFHSGTALSKEGEYVTNGGRVLGVTAIGPTITSAMLRAYNGVGHIKFKDMHCRTDIGKKAIGR